VPEDDSLLTDERAVEQVRILHGFHIAEREKLDILRRYWKGRQKLPAVIPSGTPGEVRVMQRSSRVNVMPIVINSLVQSTFVEGFRTKGDEDNANVWSAWQANRMDARQSAIHRAAYAYGAAYAVVLPGDPEPVIRGVSPRSMTVMYGEDQDWPVWALERCGNGLWKLYDDKAVYYVRLDDKVDKGEFIESRRHDLGVCPVVRFLDEADLDDEDEVDAADGNQQDVPTFGQIAPLMPLQDQIDLTTFSLQIAQHYSGFRQRYIIGWAGKTEQESLKVGAQRIIAIDADPDDNGEGGGVKIGEFGQTELKGFIESREATLKHAATLSQTPVHELTGSLIQMSAEALAAAQFGRDRKVDERKTNLGESHEQTFWVVGKAKGVEVPADAEVKWRDTSARAFAATVDALGKLATMLNVPPQELWERVPDTTKQDIERWKEAAQRGNSFDDLSGLLDRQAKLPSAV
jgi:hypothetical protein